jgi:hypothetical protein
VNAATLIAYQVLDASAMMLTPAYEMNAPSAVMSPFHFVSDRSPL